MPNPAPGRSFGYVGVFGSVETRNSSIDGFLVLKIARDQLRDVRPESVRLFRWEPKTRRFAPIPHSMIASDRTYAAARISRGGTYALIGLHKNSGVIDTMRIACQLREQMSRETATRRRAAKQRICELILCERELDGVPAPGTGLSPGTGPRPGPVPGPQGPCETCTGMPDDAMFDLPECHLLAEKEEDGGCIDGSWESLGPHEITGGQVFNRGIGCAKQLAMDPSRHHTVYATGEHGGAWVLDDAGEWPEDTWRPIGDSLEQLQMRALAVAETNWRHLYVGNALGHVYVTRDRGMNWALTSSRDFGFIRRLLIHRTNADTVFVASSLGLFLSPDAGATWSELLDPAEFPAPDVLDAAMDPGDSAVLYIGVRARGVYKTYDSGQNWELVLPFSAAAEGCG